MLRMLQSAEFGAFALASACTSLAIVSAGPEPAAFVALLLGLCFLGFAATR